MKREFPEGPVAAVGCVAFRRDSILLIRRGHEPFKGYWSIPGGAVELGETAEEALVRETMEESGVEVEPVQVLGVFDNIVRRADRVWFHYMIVDFLAVPTAGEPKPGDGEMEARWVPLVELSSLELTPQAGYAIRKGLEVRGP
jgi:mutator protein MutT